MCLAETPLSCTNVFFTCVENSICHSRSANLQRESTAKESGLFIVRQSFASILGLANQTKQNTHLIKILHGSLVRQKCAWNPFPAEVKDHKCSGSQGNDSPVTLLLCFDESESHVVHG